MAGETGSSADAIPLLPQGIVLFMSLPMRAVVIDALGPTVRDGALVVRGEGCYGVVVIRDSTMAEVFAVDRGSRSRGSEALQVIRQWPDATVSAHRLDPAVLDIVPVLTVGTVCYEAMRLEWVDVHRLLHDVRGRAGTHVVELNTPAGRGVAAFRDGEPMLAYTESATGPLSILDPLTSQSAGGVTVRRLESQPGESLDTALAHLFGRAHSTISAQAIAAEQRSLLGARELGALAPELKAVARQRLLRSSVRVEELVDDAVAAGRTIEWVASTVRETAIRGVVPERMQELAGEMMALANRPARRQGFLPA